MRIAVLFNPSAGSAAKLDALRPSLPHATFLPSESPDDLTAKAVEAAASGRYDRLVVAGGDGTVHAVVNALAASPHRIDLAILPLGTGNDLCRTLGVPLDPEAAVEHLTAPARPLDLIRVTGAADAYSVNVVTGGFSGMVAAEVTGELKQSWGPLAYLRGAVGSLADPPVFHLTLRFDGGRERTIDVLNLVVANARTAAGGFVVAPTASPEDGRFDVVLIRPAGAADLSIVAARLMEGDYTHDPNVLHRRARKLELRSDPPIPLSIDGEQTEGAHFTFEIVPKAVRVAVGPDYRVPPTPTLGSRMYGLASGFLRLLVRTRLAILGGLLLAAAAAGLFGWLAAGVMRGEWADWNEDARRSAVAASNPTTDALAWGLSRFADWWSITTLGLLAVGLFLRRRRNLDAAVTVALLLGALALERGLKWAFRVARPTAEDRLEAVSWYSFPSGHALWGTVVYGGLAAVLAYSGLRSWVRWPLVGLLVLVAAGVCWSRVQLRVHWLTDVIGGAVAGVCWVSACLLARHYARSRRTGL